MGMIVSDSFTRADSSTLGVNWTPWVDSAVENKSPEILSNQAATGSLATHDSYSIFSGAGWTGGNDQYAELNPIKCTNQSGLGPLGRMTVGTNTNTTRGYVAYVDDVGVSSVNHGLFRIDDNTVKTQLGSSFTATIVATDVVRIECQGTTIRYLVNGVVKVTATDSTYATGNPGIFLGRDSAAGDSIADNWAAGDFSGTPSGGAGDLKSRRAIRPAAFKPMGDAFRTGKFGGWR